MMNKVDSAVPELSQNDTSIQLFAENSPDPIFIQTEESFAYLNPAACVFFGIPAPERLLGTPVTDRICSSYKAEAQARIRRLNIGREAVPELFEEEFVRLDGSSVWAQTKGIPVVFDGKNGAIVFLKDTSRGKAAESALRRIDSKYTILFREARIPVLLTRYPSRVIVDVNRAWEDLLGFTLDEVLGKSSDELGITRYTGDIKPLEELLEREGSVKNFELQLWRRDGAQLTVLTNIHVFEYDNEHYEMITCQDITDRKRTEGELFEISEKFQKSFDYSAIGMCMVSMDGILLNVNNKMCDIFGCAREQLEGVSFSSITYAPDIEMTRENMQRLAAGEVKVTSQEKRYIRSSGDIFWSFVVATVVMDAANKPAFFIVQLQDITERKEMEEMLLAKERFNTAIMDHLPIGIAVNSFKPPLNFSYMNENFPKFYRTTREALAGTDVFFDAVYEDPEFRAEIRQRVLEDMESGDPQRMRWENIPITRKNGETSYVTASNAFVPEQELQISIVSDATERVHTHEALRKNAVRFRSLYEFGLAIIKGFKTFADIGDKTLRCVFELLDAETAGICICGGAHNVHETVRGSRDDDDYSCGIQILPEEDVRLLSMLLEDTVYHSQELPEHGLRRVVQRIFSSKGMRSGLVKPLYSSEGFLGLIYAGRGDSGGFSTPDCELFQEIGLQAATAVEQKRLQQQNERYSTGLEEMIDERTGQLEAVVKELEAFTYSVSHDLRAPLRSMNGFVRILLEDYGSLLDDEGRRVCGVISSSAQQMGRLIDDLLSLSRIGRSDMVVMPVDMEQMVWGLYTELTTEEQRDSISISVERLPEAEADPTLIRQVWMNLLDNAIKFSSKKKDARISVQGKDNGREIVYAVSDNGAGFDMQFKDKLFGVFQRLHSVKEFEGTGVGLAIVHRIVNRHGGRVWAVGEENEGATFFFSIRKEPLADGTGNG